MSLPEGFKIRTECNSILESISSLKDAHSNPFNESRPSTEELRNLQLIHLIPGRIRIDGLLDLYRYKVEGIGDEREEQELNQVEGVVKEVEKTIFEFLEDERWKPAD